MSGGLSEKIGLKYSKTSYVNLLEKLEKLVLENIEEEFFLIFDDLDEMNINLETESHYQKIINGLLYTANELNLLFRNHNKKCQIIIIIRDDIIDKLHITSTNSNKRISEKSIHLNWVVNKNVNPWEHPLSKLILYKVKVSNSKLQNKNDSEVYFKLFPNKVDDKYVTEYILDRTLGRPRDFIKFLNIVKEENPKSFFISKSMIKNSSTAYSNWFYDELLNEMSIHKDPIFINSSLRLIENYKQSKFTYLEIKNYYDENVESFKGITNLKECINFLYCFGILGNSWEDQNKKYNTNPKRRKFYKQSWSYRPDGNNNPDYTKEFIVHYGLRKKFSM